MQRLLSVTALAAILATPAVASAYVPLALSSISAAQESALKTGAFRGAEDHNVSGTAKLVRESGKLFIELSDFESDRGPDLVLWLTKEPVASSEAGKDAEKVSLGRIQSAKRDVRRYEVPAGLSESDIGSVVVWCRAFGVLFGSADLA